MPWWVCIRRPKHRACARLRTHSRLQPRRARRSLDCRSDPLESASGAFSRSPSGPLLSSIAAVNCSSFVCFALPLSRAVTVCRSLYVAPQHRASGTFNAPHCTVQAARCIPLHCKYSPPPTPMDHRSRPWRWAQLSAAVRRSGRCLFVCASLADCALLRTSLLERAPASDGCPAGLAHSHCH